MPTNKITVKLNAGELLNKLKYRGDKTIEFAEGYDACKKQLAMLLLEAVNVELLEIEGVKDAD